MSTLALRLIAENKKTRSRSLDLGNCGLTEVPIEIGELVWLEVLILSNIWSEFDPIKISRVEKESQNSGWPNRIKSIAGVEPLTNLKQLIVAKHHDNLNEKWELNNLTPIAKLVNLQLLNCSLTDLSDLTPLAGLTNLQHLSCYGTNVSDLSPLAGLTNLQQLSCSSSLVSDLSPLNKLTSLRQLYCYNTQVSDLLPLAGLSNLLQLECSETPINNLSPLAGLTNLQQLSCASSRVTDLTPIAGLYNLLQLKFSETQVSDLSPLTGLNNLQQLSCASSRVTDLTPIARLTNLQHLDCHKTQIGDITPLAGLINLYQFNCSDTNVSDLTPVLSLIKNGIPVKWQNLDDAFQEDRQILNKPIILVKDCPISTPPFEIIRQGPKAILNYFNENEKQGTVKGCEAKMLLVGDGGAGKTSLLRRLFQKEKPLPEESESTKGIDIHRHEFKMTDGNTFRLNVWDFGGQEIYHATHQFFLTKRSLYILLDDTRKNHKTVHDEGFKYWLEVIDLLSDHSPVLIFQNEKGNRSKRIDIAGIKGKFDNVKDVWSGNLKRPGTADKFGEVIEHYAKNLPLVGEHLPAKWVSIRSEIEKKAEKTPYITQKEFFEIYSRHLKFNRTKALFLSHYLHDLGVFLHYQDDSLLARTVILQNTWATEAVFKILDDEIVKGNWGRFVAEDCARVWRDSKYADMHPELLALMQKFELCYLLTDAHPSTWLVPQLLPPSKPAELINWVQPGDLVLRYIYEFLPKGMVSRLMVRMHRFVTRSNMSWTTGVFFEHYDAQVLVEIPSRGNEIVLRARGQDRKELLSIIASDLDALNSTYYGLQEKVSKWVPCNCAKCKTLNEPEFFEENLLRQFKKDGVLKWPCTKSYKMVKVLELLDGAKIDKFPAWANKDLKQLRPLKIFISYSNQDRENFLVPMLDYLKPLMRSRLIETWDDSLIPPGEEWDAAITSQIRAADVILLLVSANSLNTDYIWNVEIEAAMRQYYKRGVRVIPIILSKCLWTEKDREGNYIFPPAKLNALPAKGKPVKEWVNQEDAWDAVASGIKAILKKLT